MEKLVSLLVALVFVSGCIGNDIRGNVSIDDEGLTITPEPIKIEKQSIIDMMSEFIADLLNFDKEKPSVNEFSNNSSSE